MSLWSNGFFTQALPLNFGREFVQTLGYPINGLIHVIFDLVVVGFDIFELLYLLQCYDWSCFNSSNPFSIKLHHHLIWKNFSMTSLQWFRFPLNWDSFIFSSLIYSHLEAAASPWSLHLLPFWKDLMLRILESELCIFINDRRMTYVAFIITEISYRLLKHSAN